MSVTAQILIAAISGGVIGWALRSLLDTGYDDVKTTNQRLREIPPKTKWCLMCSEDTPPLPGSWFCEKHIHFEKVQP